jgi:TatD DNase family protein
MIYDSHCHLNDPKLYPNRAEIIRRAMDNGVAYFLCVGWDVESSKLAISIAHEFPSVYAAVGLHPENLEGVDAYSLEEIKKMAKDHKVVSIGEIGLDYHWFKDEKDHIKQKEWFIKQIDLANELGLPVSIHARDATQDTYDILKEHPVLKKGNLHCYSGSKEMMLEFAKLGYYFGFDGPITYKNSIVPKECVKACPADRLLMETDSPYLSPIPYRGQDNEPAHVKEIAEQMALFRGEEIESLENRLLNNFKNLFHVEQ